MSATAQPLPLEHRGRRPDIEHELDERYAVHYTFREAVPIAEFDQAKSLHNQARFEAIDEKTVELYTEAVKRGDAFPAVIAYRPTPRSRLVMIDGNHRLSAHIRAQRPVDVYEVDTDTDRRAIALMTYSFNTRHGRPTSENERLQQAKYLVDNGSTIPAAAAAVSIPQAHLKKFLTRAAADARADEVGLKRNEWDALGASIRGRLVNISTDEGFAEAAKLAYAARLDTEEVFELCSLLGTTKSGDKQKAIVAQYRELKRDKIQAAGGGTMGNAGRRALGPRQRLAMALGQAIGLPEDDKAIVEAYAPGERKDAAKNIRTTAERLARLATALEKAR